MKQIRLNKLLASSGIASRRKCDELIEDGIIKINGKICTRLGTTVCPDKDFITINSKPLAKFQQVKKTYILNKPAGYVCSCKRVNDEKLTIDLIKTHKDRLYTIGRLDKHTSGLILVTSDGDFAHKVMHPSSAIERQYIAETKEAIGEDNLKQLIKGTYIDQRKIRPTNVSKIKNKSVSITVMEGKKHEVRILLDRAGLTTSRLKRVRIGQLELKNLPSGAYKLLSKREKMSIFAKKSSIKKGYNNKL